MVSSEGGPEQRGQLRGRARTAWSAQREVQNSVVSSEGGPEQCGQLRGRHLSSSGTQTTEDDDNCGRAVTHVSFSRTVAFYPPNGYHSGYNLTF